MDSELFNILFILALILVIALILQEIESVILALVIWTLIDINWLRSRLKGSQVQIGKNHVLEMINISDVIKDETAITKKEIKQRVDMPDKWLETWLKIFEEWGVVYKGTKGYTWLDSNPKLKEILKKSKRVK